MRLLILLFSHGFSLGLSSCKACLVIMPLTHCFVWTGLDVCVLISRAYECYTWGKVKSQQSTKIDYPLSTLGKSRTSTSGPFELLGPPQSSISTVDCLYIGGVAVGSENAQEHCAVRRERESHADVDRLMALDYASAVGMGHLAVLHWRASGAWQWTAWTSQPWAVQNPS